MYSPDGIDLEKIRQSKRVRHFDQLSDEMKYRLPDLVRSDPDSVQIDPDLKGDVTPNECIKYTSYYVVKRTESGKYRLVRSEDISESWLE